MPCLINIEMIWTINVRLLMSYYKSMKERWGPTSSEYMNLFHLTQQQQRLRSPTYLGTAATSLTVGTIACTDWHSWMTHQDWWMQASPLDFNPDETYNVFVGSSTPRQPTSTTQSLPLDCGIDYIGLNLQRRFWCSVASYRSDVVLILWLSSPGQSWHNLTRWHGVSKEIRHGVESVNWNYCIVIVIVTCHEWLMQWWNVKWRTNPVLTLVVCD